jgi:hypothetical protein
MRNPLPVTAILLTLTACTVAIASEEAKPPLQAAQVVSGSGLAFDNLKKLVGRWEAPLGNNKTIVDTFQTFAFDTAILGEEWVDGKQITSTVFYMVGSQLRADHYCDYLNQPRYVAKASTDPSVVDFVFREATNLDAHAKHFHSTTWHFIDADHLVQEWRIEGSPKGNSTVRLNFVRKDQDTPKTASRGHHGYENAASRGGSAQSATGVDFRQLWRAAKHLGYVAINVLGESLGVRWCIEDQHVRGRLRHGTQDVHGPDSRRFVLFQTALRADQYRG